MRSPANQRSVEAFLIAQHWDDLKVVYGLRGAYARTNPRHDEVVSEVARLLRGGHKTTLYKLDGSLNLVPMPHQDPPFATLPELTYELFKESELVAFWLCNPAISVVYGFGDYTPGDRRCIALLAQLADMVGAGKYKGQVLTADLQVADAPLQRYGIVGLFDNPTEKDTQAVIGLLDREQPYVRFVAAWALRHMSKRSGQRDAIAERFRQLRQTERDEDVKLEAEKARAVIEG